MKNQKMPHGQALSLLFVLAVMAAIFCLSAQNGEKSGQLSGKFTTIAIQIFVPSYEDLDAASQMQIGERASFVVRKLAHFAEFALLGFSLMLHAHTIEAPKKLRRPARLAFCVGVLYALTDELHQLFIGGREASLRDVGIDSLGVCFGIAVLLLLLRAICVTRSRRGDTRARRP